MKPEIKAKWLEALRSGNYEQGKGALRRQQSFCCLGVLCDLHAKETGEQWEEEAEAEHNVRMYLGEPNYLPEEVMEWAELQSPNPPVGASNLFIANHNDQGKTFPEIANLIETDL